MALPKCRLEVWKPKIRLVTAAGVLGDLYEPDRWVACETHEDVTKNQRRGNAVESINITENVFAPMSASIRLTNRPSDFKTYDDDVYKHLYKDSDGAPIPNYPSYPNTLSGGEVYLRQRWGVFTNFFYEFQHIRLVDTETHLVLFAGRITKIVKRYEDGSGSIVIIEAKDALDALANMSTSALVRSASFEDTHRRSDLVKYLLNLATDYEANQPSTGPQTNVDISTITVGSDPDNPHLKNVPNNPSSILTNVDIGTSDTINQYSRFERSAVTFTRDTEWDCEMTGTKHVLGEIARWAMLDPHASNTSEEAFGYDFFVDANYGKKNLMADIGPGVTGFNAPHFNYFKRGNRLSAASSGSQDAAVYGMTVKYPTRTSASREGARGIDVGQTAASIANATVTTIEVTSTGIIPGMTIKIDGEYMYVKQLIPDVEGVSGNVELDVIRGYASTTAASHNVNVAISNPRSAQTIMQRGFNFDDSKEDLYTEAVLTWNTKGDNVSDGSGTQESEDDHFSEKRLEIMYVTEVALGTVPDTNTTFHWNGKNINADFKSSDGEAQSAEWVDVYNAAGAKQLDDVARIQYQSHSTITGSTNFAYILLSDIKSTFPSSNYGSETYVELRGATSGAKCRLNLASGLSEAHEGRPSQVWGTHRVMDMGIMNDADTTDLRHEVAARLAQATTGLRQGAYAFSKAPYYWWDGLVHSVATAATDNTLGQDITVKDINGSTAINITNFGVREGMLVHKMTANHAGIEQNPDTNNPAIQLDTYGYIGRMTNNTTFAVNLGIRDSLGGLPTSGRTFAVGDPIRIFIPVRAGTEVFVDNLIADIYGEHIVSRIEYNEDPIPDTRLTSIGKNESRLGGGHRVKGLISSIAQTTLTVKEKIQTVQPPVLGSIMGAVTVTLPNGSEAHTALKATWSAGSVRLVDGRTFNFAAGSTAVATYGLNANMVANQHYIVYLDPLGENLGGSGTYHLYTKRVGTYKRDSDNIPVFHIIATNTAGVAKPIIRLQPNMYLDHTEAAGGGVIPLTQEASAVIDVATIKEELLQDFAVTTHKLTNAVLTGKAFVDTGLEIDTAGYVRTASKTQYTDTDAGFWLGMDNSVHKLNIGDASNYIKWTGTGLEIKGTITLTGESEALDPDDLGESNDDITAAHLTGKVAALTMSNTQMYISTGTGAHNDANTAFFVDSSGNFSLKNKFVWTASSGALDITGNLTVGSGDAVFKANAQGIYLGNANHGSAPFHVALDGTLTASSGTFTGTVLAGGFSTDSSNGIKFTNNSTDNNFEDTSYLKFKVGTDTKGYMRAFSSPDDIVMLGTKDGGTIRIGSPPGGGGGNANNVNTEAIQLFFQYLGIQSGDDNTRQYWIAPGAPAAGKFLTANSTGSTTIAGESAQTWAQLGWSDTLRLGDGSNTNLAIARSGDTTTGFYFYDSNAYKGLYCRANSRTLWYAASDGTNDWFYMDSWVNMNNHGIVDCNEIQVTDGADDDPSFTFSTDLDSGMWYNTTDAGPSITMGGNDKMTWTTNKVIVRDNLSPNSTASYRYLGSGSYRWAKLYASAASDTSSDAELKENMTPISNGLDFISRLSPITFNRINDSEVQFGFTAQAMKQAVLDSGYTENLGVYSEETDEDTGETNWGITYSTLVAPLVAAIKERKERIEVLGVM